MSLDEKIIQAEEKREGLTESIIFYSAAAFFTAIYVGTAAYLYFQK